jgi:hypothetical protein
MVVEAKQSEVCQVAACIIIVSMSVLYNISLEMSLEWIWYTAINLSRWIQKDNKGVLRLDFLIPPLVRVLSKTILVRILNSFTEIVKIVEGF